MRISESQSKIVFRDFARPIHNGKGRVDLKSIIKTHGVNSRVSTALKTGQIDIISNKVQTTLKRLDEEHVSTQERI